MLKVFESLVLALFLLHFSVFQTIKDNLSAKNLQENETHTRRVNWISYVIPNIYFSTIYHHVKVSDWWSDRNGV